MLRFELTIKDRTGHVVHEAVYKVATGGEIDRRLPPMDLEAGAFSGYRLIPYFEAHEPWQLDPPECARCGQRHP